MLKLLAVLLLIPGFMFSLTAEEIVKAVDKNQVFESQRGHSIMTIDRDGKKMVKEMKVSGIKEGNRFFVEFTNPEDKGVKYLRIDKELWIYLPDADDIMKISGHMLRQGMMGSDVSYEDMMNDEDFQSKYDSVLTGETNFEGAACYDVVMTAKENASDITYFKRRVLVDKEKMVSLEYDLYAKSGRLLKKMSMSNVKPYDNRYYATKIVIQDMKRSNSFTSIEQKDLEFDIPIAKSFFSKQNLKK